MKVPSSTYRVQLNADFPLEELRKIVDYLDVLGISTVYSAPLFQAREGSTHGYDVTDPYKINREIGTLENFRLLSELLQRKEMSWLQDIVPNHMAFDGSNPWLRDIFELGPDSKYYRFFDIDWEYKGWGKVMAPFLGNSLEEVMKNRELKVKFDEEGFSINYFDHNYPASARSYATILGDADFNGWQNKFREFSGNDMDWKDLKTGFYREVEDHPELKERIESVVNRVNQREELSNVMDLQYFLPTHWKKTEQEINYRRFFTINDLICVRMEDPEVFETYHHYIKELCEEGLINGLRIDHIDGLFDPKGYVEQLRNFLRDDFYLIVEKILEWDEDLPTEWRVEGTSGYDFLAEVNHLFTKASNADIFRKAYEKMVPEGKEYEDLVYEKKTFILKERMGGELQNLWLLIKELELLPGGDDQKERWKTALGTFMAAFPVYRIYPDNFPLNDVERQTIEHAFKEAVRRESDQEEDLKVLRSLFLGEADKDKDKMLRFLKRCQQFTGPLAAKGVEDTSFYIYNRLISHNEVGDSPENFGISIEGFHQKMLRRKNSFPLSVNATATHDTKRGEDARMRLNVLSEIPEEWFAKVEEWNRIAQKLRKDSSVPDANETYFIYQTLIAALPFNMEADEEFLTRTKNYLQKVLREAKVNSNWAVPNEAYEAGVFDFIEAILKDEEFRKSFDPFQKKIAKYGAVMSLGQTLTKVTVPGLPDVYQGTELWDLSYVDPDNRRPVDYDLRKKYITDFKSWEEENLENELNSLSRDFKNGKIKMYSLYKALNTRRELKNVFENGEYIPLELTGKAAENFISYARTEGDQWILVIVPVIVTPLFNSDALVPDSEMLEEAVLSLPKTAPKEWKNQFTGKKVSSQGKLALKDILAGFPVALLKNKT